MRLAYLDTSAGVSGDMLLAALIDAGAPVEMLRDNLARLGIGARLEQRKVRRCGIHALKADVMVGEALADAPAHRHHHHEHHEHHEHAHGNGHAHTHGSAERTGHHQAEEEEHGHFHSQFTLHHEHAHRSLSAIRGLISEAGFPAPVTQFALRTFEELGRAEAHVHGIALDAVHFHEVGAVDAIADIVLVASAVHALEVGAWHASPVNVGSGTVVCEHGRYPVPAPATAELLRGVPTYASGVQMELTTPTGAALLRALDCQFGPMPAMKVGTIGYGAGSRDPSGFANVLRVSIGETASLGLSSDVVTVIETAIDDLSPQVLAYVADKALRLGALDVVCVPAQMKKGRSGMLVTVLAPPARAEALQDLLLSETSSLGLRVRDERRVLLPRGWVTATTMWGPVRIKVGHRDGVEWNAAPEYEDCRAIAEEHAVPLKNVITAALQAYRTEHPQ